MEGTSETPHYQIRGRARTAQTHRERSGWLCSEGSGLRDSVKVPFPEGLARALLVGRRVRLLWEV